MFRHYIHYGEQLMHTSSKSYLLFLTVTQKTLVKDFDVGLVTKDVGGLWIVLPRYYARLDVSHYPD